MLFNLAVRPDFVKQITNSISNLKPAYVSSVAMEKFRKCHRFFRLCTVGERLAQSVHLVNAAQQIPFFGEGEKS